MEKWESGKELDVGGGGGAWMGLFFEGGKGGAWKISGLGVWMFLERFWVWFGFGVLSCPSRLSRSSCPSRSTTFQVASVPFNHVFKRRSGIISASRGRGNHPSVEAVWKTLLLLANMIHETNATNETNATDNLQPHKPKTS